MAAPSKWKKFVPKKASVLAYRHEGGAEQVSTADGTETVYPGQYVVQVGTITHTQIVPPKDGKPGTTVAGEVPRLEVMSAEDFESLYESA